MTARVWTVEELDRVHPLPDGDEDEHGWRWHIAHDGSLRALGWYDDHDGVVGEHQVVYWRGALISVCGDYNVPPPGDVALAVILASQGLDSREAMALCMENTARDIESKRNGQPGYDVSLECAAAATRRCAVWVRRGTVAP